jgi:hypothetical protein
VSREEKEREAEQGGERVQIDSRKKGEGIDAARSSRK